MRRSVAAAFALLGPILERPAHAEMEPLPPPPVVICARRVDVWAALTTPKEIAATHGGQAIVDLRPGGSIRRHADASATPDAPGWTSAGVLAYVAPRLLVLAGETPSTWTAIELDELAWRRTRLRVAHVGATPGTRGAAAAEADDRALVARLRRRFPDLPDPVLAAFKPLAGTWEERAREGGDLLARWTIQVTEAPDPSDLERSNSVTLTRKTVVGSEADRWIFWREAESGRWIGGRVEGGRLSAWELIGYESGGCGWFDRWEETSPAYEIEGPPRDDVVEASTRVGCTGHAGFRWTRAAAPK